ncbi:nickel pincer cofactor biosynthesis protein LarC [Halomonas dongshanensis]|uniref:Putative nickel insertion protein n=1 Tax=Halomonas dongshanensis TaxID=2890835 RepID=A0ABT2E920_9GAMM|nr:nickel pincer cofactor biosynthesis protein LarC [Halomonas dongshanensis]
MTPTLHIDCTFGIAGDMLLAALVDLGADLDAISAELRKLPLDDFSLSTQNVMRCAIRARLLNITLAQAPEPAPEGLAQYHTTHEHSHTHSHSHSHGHSHDHSHDHAHSHSHDHSHGHDHGHPQRLAGDILAMLAASHLPPRVKQRATAIFSAIAEAEGRIHDLPPQAVHLHEVGAMDSIIDIIGVCLALEALDIDTITATPVPVGHGVVDMAHGNFPIPAPATLELLKGIPLSSFDAQGELTTPTGAALLKVLVERFTPTPQGTPLAIGYGAGNREFAHPNVLRAVRLAPPEEEDADREHITVLECQLDDTTGEQLGFALETLLAEGALDVFHTPIGMKKSRPGVLVSVLATPERADALEHCLLKTLPTFGVRRSAASRRILVRRFEEVTTELGTANVKLGYLNGHLVRVSAEYEDVARLARAHGRSIDQVQRLVLNAWEQTRSTRQP